MRILHITLFQTRSFTMLIHVISTSQILSIAPSYVLLVTRATNKAWNAWQKTRPHAMSYAYLDVDVNQQCESQVFTDGVVDTDNVLQLKEKRKLEINCNEKETNDVTESISNNVPRKKSRPSVWAPRRAETSKEESSNVESSSCSSEDELNGESNANCKSKNNSNSKSKANRGCPTASQSLYARKLRKKINQRLRILQNLVPNGTKVDISTMLEEAVQYVNFLQMQIKLLSSYDLWMYAPLAYNEVNINIDLRRCQYSNFSNKMIESLHQ